MSNIFLFLICFGLGCIAGWFIKDYFSSLHRKEKQPCTIEVITTQTEPTNYKQFQDLLKVAIEKYETYHDRYVKEIVKGLQTLIKSEGKELIFSEFNDIIYYLYNYKIHNVSCNKKDIMEMNPENLTKNNLEKLLLITRIEFINEDYGRFLCSKRI